MAMQRLVESYSFDNDTFKNNIASHKITEAEILKLSKGRLSEETKNLLEKNSSLISEKTVWRFPISRFDWKNANGRIYEKRLWQRVIDEQKDNWQGNVGLADHPLDEEDGSFKNVAIVWLNMGLNEKEKLVWAEGIFVGPYGKLAEEIIEAGGRVGFSSSGYGELDENDNSTVRWDTFILERCSDLVLNPSQKVYGTKENLISQAKPVTENTITNLEDKTDKVIQENTIMPEANTNSGNVKMSKHEIRRFREDIVTYLGEVKEQEDLQEKLKQLEEIRSYFSADVAPDLLAEVEKQIEETKKAIDEAIKEHSKIVKTFGVTKAEELKEGVKNLAIDTRLYERTAEDWKKITEGLQKKITALTATLNARPTVEAYKSLLVQMESLKQEFNSKLEEASNKQKVAEKKVEKIKTINEKLIQELEVISKENDSLKEHNDKLKEYATKLREKFTAYKESHRAVLNAIEEKKMEENTVRFKPKNDARQVFANFNESSDVLDYYSDLVDRYGSKITPYKESIVSCKTLKEAMYNFNKIFAELGKDRTSVVTGALPVEERKKIIEATTGVVIKKSSKMESRLPDGWE